MSKAEFKCLEARLVSVQDKFSTDVEIQCLQGTIGSSLWLSRDG